MAGQMQGALADLLREKIARMDRSLEALQAVETEAAGMDTMTYAATISLDVTLAALHKTTTVHATGDATINASAAGTAGMRLWVLIVNDGTGAKTITFGTNFRASATVVGTVSKAAVVMFISDGTAWFEVSRSLVL